MNHFRGILVYMSIVRAPNTDAYWSQVTLYGGLRTKALIWSRNRYKQMNKNNIFK